ESSFFAHISYGQRPLRIIVDKERKFPYRLHFFSRKGTGPTYQVFSYIVTMLLDLNVEYHMYNSLDYAPLGNPLFRNGPELLDPFRYSQVIGSHIGKIPIGISLEE